MTRRSLLAILLGALCLGAAPALADHGAAQRADRALEGWPIGAFALVDQRGHPFTDERLQGRWTFLLFGDSRCGEPCTAALSALAGLHRRIAGTDAVKTTQVIFVSLDPQRDTPGRLRRYLAHFDERFIGATGPRATLRSLVQDLGLAPPASAGPGLVNAGTQRYSGSLWLIGPDAAVRAEFLPPFDVPRLTSAYLKTRARR